MTHLRKPSARLCSRSRLLMRVGGFATVVMFLLKKASRDEWLKLLSHRCSRKGEARGLFSVLFVHFPNCLGLFVGENRNAHAKICTPSWSALNGAGATHLSCTLLY